MKEVIFVITGSFQQFEQYCKHKEYRSVKYNLFEDMEGNEVRFLRKIRCPKEIRVKKVMFFWKKRYEKEMKVKKIILTGNWLASPLFKKYSMNSITSKLDTIYEYDYY